jgi:hypothetical protein
VIQVAVIQVVVIQVVVIQVVVIQVVASQTIVIRLAAIDSVSQASEILAAAEIVAGHPATSHFATSHFVTRLAAESTDSVRDLLAETNLFFVNPVGCCFGCDRLEKAPSDRELTDRDCFVNLDRWKDSMLIGNHWGRLLVGRMDYLTCCLIANLANLKLGPMNSETLNWNRSLVYPSPPLADQNYCWKKSCCRRCSLNLCLLESHP